MPEDPPQEPPGGPSTGRSAASEGKLIDLFKEVSETASQLATLTQKLMERMDKLRAEMHLGKTTDTTLTAHQYKDR